MPNKKSGEKMEKSNHSNNISTKYPIKSLKLLGSDIESFVILAKKADDTAANVIREYISNLTGIKLQTVTDGSPKKAIVLGNVGTKTYRELTLNLKNDEYIIKTFDGKLYLGTKDNAYYEDGPAVHKFIENYLGYDFKTNTVKNEVVDIKEIDECDKIDDYIMKIADKEFLAQIDTKAEKLKNEILYSKTDITYSGNAYYVSNSGNDENDGLTPQTPWKTLDRVTNASELVSGDAVFFKRGDIFRGGLGTVKGVTYSAYGDGVKPKIWHSPVDGAIENSWEEVAHNVWKYNYDFGYQDIGAVILNHGEKVAIKICPDYSQTPVLNNWTDKPFSYKTMDMDLYFYCATDKKHSHLVDTELGYLYMCCKEGNPAEVFRSIEFNVCFNIIGGSDGTTFDNLCVQYGGYHGINAGRHNCTIQNCEISYIGGCYQWGADYRFGNGIELWGNGSDFTIKNCYVHDCFDTGITHQGVNCTYENIQYYNNLLEYTNANIEYFNSNDGNSEPKTNKDIKFYNNICRYAGYGWGAMRAETIKKGWGPYFHVTGLGPCKRPENDDSCIFNNIFQYSKRWLIRTLAGKEEWLIPYKDNIFIEYEGGYVGSAANTTGDKHGVYSTFDYSGIDSREYRNNTFYLVKKDLCD